LAIDGAGRLFWNNDAIDRAGMRERFAAAARQQPQPEVHLRADKATAYQIIAEVLAASANAGVTRIGFVSDPNEAKP
jgi:biopolymer transport protein ExbD